MRTVVKFGGSSLADRDRVTRAAQRIRDLQQAGQQVIAVVSAQGHTTDRLLAETEDLVPSRRELDAYLAVGEQLSAGCMAMTLEGLGVPAVSLTGWQAGIRTDGVHGDARVLGLEGDRILRELAAGRVAVVTGFQGLGPNGDITTLGRGGSDTTAVALAAFLQARCLIYTDVDGVYDRDPRKFPDARRFDRLDYDIMLSMARSGAQVLHDRCVELAKAHGVQLRVLSSFREGPGTLVGA